MTDFAMRRFCADFDDLASLHANRVAVIDASSGREWAWADLNAMVKRAGAYFQANAGNQRVTIVAAMPNSVELLVIFLAAAYFGHDFGVAPQNAPASEVDAFLNLIRPDFVIAAATEGLHIRTRNATITLDGEFSWLPDRQIAPPHTTLPTGSLCVSTSGTTGKPKAIVHDIDTLWSSGHAFASVHRLDPESRFFNFLPMSYLGGTFNLSFIPLAHGGSVVVGAPFSGSTFFRFWQDIQRFDITVLWLVPTIVRGLLSIAARVGTEHSSAARKGVRFALLGTAPIEMSTKVEFEKTFGIALLENYALSETTFLTSELLGSDLPRSEGSVGSILPYASVRLEPLSGDADEVAGGARPTQIFARSPFMFKGYRGEDDTLERPTGDDGHMPTGDLAEIGPEGVMRITGRAKDIIKRGGILVSMRELEVCIEQHPDVMESAAVPVPHEFYGEDSVIFVRLKDGSENADTAKHLHIWMTQRLSRSKWPQKVVCLHDLPKTQSGKILKRSLKELA